MTAYSFNIAGLSFSVETDGERPFVVVSPAYRFELDGTSQTMPQVAYLEVPAAKNGEVIFPDGHRKKVWNHISTRVPLKIGGVVVHAWEAPQ